MSRISDIFKLKPEHRAEHRIRYYVYLIGADGSKELIPRESTMRGDWPMEAKCSCGWETRTGGGVRSWIEKQVQDHKFDVNIGLWKKEEK
jgi:hypothetical protein